MIGSEWLANLRPGDTVIMDATFRKAVGVVERMTKTQIVLTNGDRFRRDDGFSIGRAGGAYRSHLRAATPELVDSIKRRELIDELKLIAGRAIDDAIPTDHIEQAVALLQKPTGTENA